MTMTRNHTARAALVAVLVAAVAAGCGVPTSGPTTRVEQVPDDVSGAPGLDEPLLPTSNAEDTVKAFLGAAAGEWSGRDDRLNAFVSAGTVAWSEPESGDQLVRVRDGDIDVEPGANATSARVKVTGRIIGTYNTDGQVERAGSSDDFDQTFELERDDASQVWRLKDPPQQVMLLDSTFDERYDTHSLYFPAKGDASSTLVPDVRWVPSSLRNDQERYALLAEWLLEGPSDWLADSVDSSFPRNTASKQVKVENSTVTVDVSSQSASQEMGAPSDMSAQLAWSLGLADNQRLSLLVDGQERANAPVSDWDGRSRVPADDTAARNLSYFLSDGAVQSDRPDAPFVSGESLGLTSAVLEPRGDRLAGVASGTDGQYLITGTEDDLTPIDGFSAAVASDPQWFSGDRLMVLADGAPRIVAIDGGKSKKVEIDGVDGSVTQLSLAPDARRLAYVIDGETWVVPITEVDDLTVRTGEPHRVGHEVSNVRDIGWSQETRLLMIGDGPKSEDWLWEVSIDNAYQEPLEGARDSAAVADSLGVRCAFPKDTDEVGQPIIVAVGDNILRVFSDTVKAVTSHSDKEQPNSATGYAPFTAP